MSANILIQYTVKILAFTTLWTNSAVNKLMIFFLSFPENTLWHFMQIVSWGDKEMICVKYQNQFSGKNEKICQNVIIA